MSFNGLLNKLCTIQKLTEIQSNLSGQINKTWVDVAVGVKCRLDEAKGEEFKTET